MTAKLVVITGASSGFGAAVAKKLSAAGHPLLLLARRLDKLKALDLPNTLCRAVDVSDRDTLEAAIDEAQAQFGPVDALINNAGIMLLGHVENQSPQEWQQMFSTNVMGLLHGMQVVLDGMKQRQSGTIINVSSVAGVKTYEEHAVYSGTKFAVHGISESVRWEMAPHNVRVVTISPGAAETELLDHTTSDAIRDDYKSWKDRIGGVISAEDVADAIVFAYQAPQHVCIRDLVITPTKQQN
jgi:NADP-dependent 3-hydroxy acid dehydrogenase YdfG